MKTWRLARVAYLTLLACLCLLPFYWMFIGAVGPSSNLTGQKVSWWPGSFSLSAFADVWSAVPLLRYLGNSLLVGFITTLISVSIAFLGAYGLVRYRPKGAGVITAFILFTLTIPGVSALVPYYDLLTRIGALDTRWGLALSYTVWALPFDTLLLRGYLQASLSLEIEEAAMLDGCNRWSVIRKVTLPLSRPGLIAAGTFTILLAWNEYIWASVLLNNQSKYTAPVGLQLFIGQFGNNVNLGLWMAGAIYVTLPVIIGFLSLQRHFVTVYRTSGR